ncbi:hypothetical protein FHR84_003280 [Actinopolyspora biskrensis]|uniref:Uncharacterized protein n=1 Tax=Actinopolyspora biskrensis TaxID=1470178 RepID=A0A852YZA9_9ACTN|nr:hypothetical protein [Actinopolyspora biskrensis]NYH79931.1 hypothetical protein [Actinopolyspora biskrensis]
MSVRVYTLSAVAVTISAVAGLLFGMMIATTDFDAERAGSTAESGAVVISDTEGSRP